MKKTQVTLIIEEGLTDVEVAALRQLFYDALGEFHTTRGPEVETYVRRRYKLVGKAFDEKIREVDFRRRLAKRLHVAAADMQITHTDDE